MPIRIEHQPSPYAAGLAGWQIGRGAAKARQQKYALDLWQQDQQNRMFEDRQDRRQQWMEGMESQRGVQRGWQAITAGLPPIPVNAPPEQRRRLEKLYQGMAKLGTGAFGMDENVTSQLGNMLDEINSIIGSIPEPDAATELNKDVVHYDKATGKFYKTAQPGTIPWSKSRNQPFHDDSTEKAAKDRLDKAEQDQEIENRYRDDLDAYKDQQDAYNQAVKRLDEFNEKVEKEVEKLQASGEYIGKSPEQIRGDALRRLEARGLRRPPDPPPPPTRPKRPTRASAATAPATGGTAATSAAVASTTAPAGTENIPEVTIGPDRKATVVPPQATGAPGGGSVQDVDQPIDMRVTSNPGMGASDEAVAGLWRETFGGPPEPSAARVASVAPRLTGGIQQTSDETGFNALSPAFQQRARQAYEAGSPKTRAAIEERWPGIRPMEEEQQQMIVPQSPLRQHNQAQYGQRGTGEGIPSDASRMLSKIEGAGGLAGRTRPQPARPFVTKYSGALNPEASRSDEMAKWIKYQNAMDRMAASPQMTERDKEIDRQYRAEMGAGRKMVEAERKAKLQARNVIVRNDADYERLRPGTVFVGPDGILRRKV